MNFRQCLEVCAEHGVHEAHCTWLKKGWIVLHVDLDTIDERLALGKGLKRFIRGSKREPDKQRVTVGQVCWP